METERLRITLDNLEKTYFAGQTIKGQIWMNLAKRVRIRAIRVQLTGKGKCKWMEIVRQESLNKSSRSLFYSSKEIYAHDEYPLSFFEPRGVELGVGEHSFDFQVPLATNLPSSFKGSYGSIKYKLRIVIQKPWSFDEKHIIPLNIVKHMLISPACHLNATPLTKQITKTISFFGNRPITLLSVLPEDFAVRNENVKLLVTVTNMSNMNVEKLKFSILQLITYHSHMPLRLRKQERVIIFQKETGNVLKKSDRSFAHELPLPACQPSDNQLSGVINIAYEIRVEAVLRGFFKNLIVTLPLKVYSGHVEVDETLPPPPDYHDDRADNQVRGANPFETSPPAAYPQLDASLSSSVGSPSLSSQYSETSSMHSTNSDSSATTLSPAAGTGLSYANSGSSSQFNSPSARSSLRGSLGGASVPYVPYSSSPLMLRSYPPAQTALDFRQHSLTNNASETPPLCMPSTSTSFLSRLRPHSALANDLPPSYEELFGNATAPEAPETSEAAK